SCGLTGCIIDIRIYNLNQDNNYSAQEIAKGSVIDPEPGVRVRKSKIRAVGQILVGSVEFVSQMGVLSRLSVQEEWQRCNRGTQQSSNALPPTPAETGADPCYDGFCGGRLMPSSEPGTMTPAICTR